MYPTLLYPVLSLCVCVRHWLCPVRSHCCVDPDGIHAMRCAMLATKKGQVEGGLLTWRVRLCAWGQGQAHRQQQERSCSVFSDVDHACDAAKYMPYICCGGYLPIESEKARWCPPPCLYCGCPALRGTGAPLRSLGVVAL